MDIRDIKKLIELVKSNGLTEFELEEEGVRIAIRRPNGNEQVVVASGGAQPVMMAPAPVVQAPAAPAPGAASEAAPAEPDSNLAEITSPIVGTFYRSPSPDTDSFVNIGDEVDEDTVVCIIEAMKVMNEIKAERRGVVRKALIENATPVEFGQVLFLIEPL